jgi:hypothetical protein
VRLDLDRDLVGRTTDAAGLDLEGRTHVVERLLQGDDGIRTVLGRHTDEGVIDDPLGETLLAIEKNLVDELADDGSTVDRIGDYWTLRGWTLARHYFFSIFAP